MTASLWVAAPRSILWSLVGETLAVPIGSATIVRPSLGVATLELAANFAQSALSFTPIDPRITIGLESVAWPAVCAWRSVFRSTCSFMKKEFGTMKKLSLFAALLAAFGLMLLFCGQASAHPGCDSVGLHEEENQDDDTGSTLDCHEDEDTEGTHSAVLDDDKDEDTDESGHAALLDDEDDDDGDDKNHNRAAVAEDKEDDDSDES